MRQCEGVDSRSLCSLECYTCYEWLMLLGGNTLTDHIMYLCCIFHMIVGIRATFCARGLIVQAPLQGLSETYLDTFSMAHMTILNKRSLPK